MKKLILSAFVLCAAAISASADTVPACLGNNGQPIPVINQQVVQWKTSTPNDFQARAHIAGILTQAYPDKNGHIHFEIQLGPTPDTRIEVIYNEDFGPVPQLAPGMQVEACGDYITSTEQTGCYPASPDGAIIHWVHMNPSFRGHPPGFLVIDGTLCGQDAENAGPRHDPQGYPEGGGCNNSGG